MSEQVAEESSDRVQAQLDALARWVLDLQGDAAQVCYLGALVQRAQTQPDPVQRILVQKMTERKQQFLEESITSAPVNVMGASTSSSKSSASPLAELVQRLNLARSSASDAPSLMATEMQRELRSVSGARSTWAKLGAKKQLSQAMLQAPKNAGPLNSHRVALQALALMGDLSPDYLSRFVTYVDTLVALEAGQLPAPQRKRGAKPLSGGKTRQGGGL